VHTSACATTGGCRFFPQESLHDIEECIKVERFGQKAHAPCTHGRQGQATGSCAHQHKGEGRMRLCPALKQIIALLPMRSVTQINIGKHETDDLWVQPVPDLFSLLDCRRGEG